MEKKIYFKEDLRASTILGFTRPEISIVDATIVDCWTGRKKKDFVFFKLDNGVDKPIKWQASVEDLMSITDSPIILEGNRPVFEPEGYLLTIPSDITEQVRFSKQV
jgi:hypothetical protein